MMKLYRDMSFSHIAQAYHVGKLSFLYIVLYTWGIIRNSGEVWGFIDLFKVNRSSESGAIFDIGLKKT